MILTVQAQLSSLRSGHREDPRRVTVVIGIGVLSLAAWITLAVLTTRPMGMGEDRARQAIEMWPLMVIAMMLPTAVPGALFTGSRSLRRRRLRAMALFGAGYLLVWTLAGVVILPLAGLAGTDRIVLPVALALAAIWEGSSLKRRALRDCHRPRPLPPVGWRAERASLSFGAYNGWACVRVCWMLMLVASLASRAAVAWMVAVAFVVVTEKLTLRPTLIRRRAGLACLGAAAVVLVAGVV